MALTRIHRLPLLLVAIIATVLPTLLTLAVRHVQVTPDNSVLLANALGHRRNYDEGVADGLCFIKIHNVQDLALEDGVGYIYTVHGCVVHDLSGFGVCNSGDCDVRPYQVQTFLPTGGIIPTVQNIWEL